MTHAHAPRQAAEAAALGALAAEAERLRSWDEARVLHERALQLAVALGINLIVTLEKQLNMIGNLV